MITSTEAKYKKNEYSEDYRLVERWLKTNDISIVLDFFNKYQEYFHGDWSRSVRHTIGNDKFYEFMAVAYEATYNAVTSINHEWFGKRWPNMSLLQRIRGYLQRALEKSFAQEMKQKKQIYVNSLDAMIDNPESNFDIPAEINIEEEVITNDILTRIDAFIATLDQKSQVVWNLKRMGLNHRNSPFTLADFNAIFRKLTSQIQAAFPDYA